MDAKVHCSTAKLSVSINDICDGSLVAQGISLSITNVNHKLETITKLARAFNCVYDPLKRGGYKDYISYEEKQGYEYNVYKGAVFWKVPFLKELFNLINKNLE